MFYFFVLFAIGQQLVQADIAGEIPSLSIVYRIINIYTSQVLTLDASDPDPDNKPYVVRPYISSSKQHFQFEIASGAVRSDEFYIKNVGSNGRYAQINYASLDEGAPLHEWQHAIQANAVFKFINLGNNRMQIVAGHSGLCLKIREPFYGAMVEQAACTAESSLQLWWIESVSSTCKIYPQTSYRIISRQSGDSEVLEVVDASQKRDHPLDVFQLNRYNGGEHQKFLFESTGFAFLIKAKHSGMVMQVADFSYQDNVAIVQAPNHKAPGQQWMLQPAMTDEGLESGYCFLVADHSGKALDTQLHLAPNEGRKVVQSSKNADAFSQHWKLEIA